jgi:hypothetical protein
MLHMKPFKHKTTKPVEILQLHPIVAADDLPELIWYGRNFSISFSITTCRRQTLPATRNFVTSQCIVVLFRTLLSGYTLVNA